MVRKMLAIASLAACNMQAMEVSVHHVTTPEELREGIEGSNKMFDKIFEKSPLTIEGQTQYSKDHRAQRIKNLLAIKNRHDAFFKQGEEKIGFVATHADTTNPGRIIIDKGDMGTTPENRKIVGMAMMQFIKTNYPKAKTVWYALPKENPGSEELTGPTGFTKSEFMDDLHDAEFCQGWERNLQQ